MKVELVRFIHSVYFPVTLGMAIGLFPMGFILQQPGFPQGVDLSNSLLGTYVVLTQMGILFLPALVASYVCSDFSNHNILFYQSLGKSGMTYYCGKIATLLLFFSLGIVIGCLGTCLAYSDLRPCIVMILHCEAVIVTYFAAYGIVSYICGSFMGSFFICVVYSVAAIFIANTNPDSLRFIQFFDQNGFIYKDLAGSIVNLATFTSVELPRLVPCFIYAAIVLVIDVIISCVAESRWIRNGIR